MVIIIIKQIAFAFGGVKIKKKSILLISLLFTLAMIFSASTAFATENTSENGSESNLTLDNETNLTENSLTNEGTNQVVSSYQAAGSPTTKSSLDEVAALWVWSTSLSSIDPSALEDAGYTDVFVYTTQDGKGITVLNQFLTKFSGTNIRVHAWISCFASGGQWWVAHNTTRQNYVKSLISDVIDGCPGIAGIHLDYVRYGGTAYKYGVTFSTNTITNFVSDVWDLVKAKNSDLFVSAAVMPECGSNAYYYGQDYGKLSPYLDFMTPMIYKGAYGQDTAWIGTTTNWIVQHSTTMIVSGIMTYQSDSNTTPLPLLELESDLRTALANGSQGFALFRYGLIIANFAPENIFAPTPTAGNPARNAVNVPVDVVINTTFSEVIQEGTMLIELVSSSGGAVPITTLINGNVLTVTPSELLVKGTKYTLILYAGSLTNADGNPIAYYSRSFTTDGTAPTATAGSPARNAVNVAVDKVITTTFSEPIKAGTMLIELVSSSGTVVPTTASISGNVLSVTPTELLVKGTKYTLILYAGSLTDDAGNSIAYYSRSFTTDSTAPTATAGNPARNAVNVALNKVITTTFSEPIKAGNMWIELVSSSGASVLITTSINGNVLTINHAALLKKGTKYTIKLHTGSITDIAGNPLVYYYRSFTTGNT